MIATFFNKTKPNVTFSLFLLLATSCFLAVFSIHTEDFLMLFKKGFVFYLVSAFLLYLLIFSVKNHSLTLNNSYAGLFFILILSSFPTTFDYNYKIISVITLYFSFFKLYGLYNHIETQKNIFDSAFWIGVSTLFSFWNSLFLILLYISIIKNKKNSKKNIISGVIGFIVPLFLFFTYHFYFDSLSEVYSSLLNIYPSFSFSEYSKFPVIISTFFIVVFSLISVLVISPKASSISKKFFLTWRLLLTHFAITLIIIGLSPYEKTAVNTFLLCFPTALILTILVQNISLKFKKITIAIFLTMVTFQFLYLYL